MTGKAKPCKEEKRMKNEEWKGDTFALDLYDMLFATTILNSTFYILHLECHIEQKSDERSLIFSIYNLEFSIYFLRALRAINQILILLSTSPTFSRITSSAKWSASVGCKLIKTKCFPLK